MYKVKRFNVVLGVRIEKIGSFIYFKKPIVVIFNVISYNAFGLSTM